MGGGVAYVDIFFPNTHVLILYDGLRNYTKAFIHIIDLLVLE